MSEYELARYNWLMYKNDIFGLSDLEEFELELLENIFES